MRKFSYVVMLACLLLFLFGCGGIIRTDTNAYRNAAIQGLDKQGHYCVVRNQQTNNPLLDNEIGGKLEAVLGGKGFVISNNQDATYLITYEYSITSGLTSGVGSVYTPGQTSTMTMNSPSGPTTQTITTPGTTSYYPTVESEFTRKMIVKVWANTKSVGAKTPLWIGETTSRGHKDDLRLIANYMVMAIAEQFGQDSQKAIKNLWRDTK